MKLYYTSGDNSLAIRIIIHELNLDCEYEAVDLSTKLTETGEDYFKINPKGQVPALLISKERLLTENAIIQQYLADKYHAVGLLPVIPAFERYRVLEWLNFISTEVHKTFSSLYKKTVPDSVKQDVFYPLLKRKYDYIDSHLANNTYLMGKQFTLPDSYLFTSLTWLIQLNINFDPWPNLWRYFKLLNQRPSVKKSLEEENLLNIILTYIENSGDIL